MKTVNIYKNQGKTIADSTVAISPTISVHYIDMEIIVVGDQAKAVLYSFSQPDNMYPMQAKTITLSDEAMADLPAYFDAKAEKLLEAF